jgi:tRNA pseudouridine38-40 synthase
MRKEQNIKIIIEYDGTNYFGWQRLSEKKNIQSTIEDALSKILREKITITGAGRTDAGVHALMQVANFKVRSNIPLKNLKTAVNSILPKDIFIKKIEKVSSKFNARYFAKLKTYRYSIYNSPEPNVFLTNYAWHWKYPIDIKKMKKGARYLKGTKDFKAFSTAEGRENTVRTVKSIKITKKGKMIYIDFLSRSFLRKQVRMMAGFLVKVGAERLESKLAKEILNKKSGIKPVVAPSGGLCLLKIKY